MKKIYLERKSFVKFDDDHYLLYTGEQKVENYQPDSASPSVSSSDEETEATEDDAEGKPQGITAYSYEGDQEDGSTKIQAQNATYDDFTAGLVRTRYSQNQVEAILANRGDGDEVHEAEFEAYQSWRKEAKEIAQEILSREI